MKENRLFVSSPSFRGQGQSHDVNNKTNSINNKSGFEPLAPQLQGFILSCRDGPIG